MNEKLSFPFTIAKPIYDFSGFKTEMAKPSGKMDDASQFGLWVTVKKTKTKLVTDSMFCGRAESQSWGGLSQKPCRGACFVGGVFNQGPQGGALDAPPQSWNLK